MATPDNDFWIFRTLAETVRLGRKRLHLRVVAALVLWVLALGAFTAFAAEVAGSATLLVTADTLPLTPKIDQLDVRFVLRPHGWRVASIQPAGGGSQPSAKRSEESHWQLSHLQLVVSDIDADDDLDLIVVNRLSGRAESVWRNDGTGGFQRLRGARFGKARFPKDRIRGEADPGPSPGWFVAGSPHFWLSPARHTSFNGDAEPVRLGDDSRTAAGGHFPCRGRAPPSPFLL